MHTKLITQQYIVVGDIVSEFLIVKQLLKPDLLHAIKAYVMVTLFPKDVSDHDKPDATLRADERDKFLDDLYDKKEEIDIASFNQYRM